MTREEAAEELLKADPYVVCDHCYGDGYVPGIQQMQECPVCFTVGKLTRRKFIQACVLLEVYPHGLSFTRAVAEDQ